MKKILFIILLCVIFISWWVWSYTATSDDKNILDRAQVIIDTVDDKKILTIHKKVLKIQSKLSKTHTRLSGIQRRRLKRIQYIIREIYKKVLLSLEERWYDKYGNMKMSSIKLIFDGTSFRGDGYLLRFKTQDGEIKAKNAILQVRLPKDFCLEYVNKGLPKDFVKFGFHNSVEWKPYSNALITAELSNYKTVLLCDVWWVKIFIPKETNFFSKGYAIGIRKEKKHVNVSDLPVCLDFLLTADNMQYEENKFCFEKLPKNYYLDRVYLTMTKLLSEWLITIK